MGVLVCFSSYRQITEHEENFFSFIHAINAHWIWIGSDRRIIAKGEGAIVSDQQQTTRYSSN
jgi:hypothetical protein